MSRARWRRLTAGNGDDQDDVVHDVVLPGDRIEGDRVDLKSGSLSDDGRQKPVLDNLRIG